MLPTIEDHVAIVGLYGTTQNADEHIEKYRRLRHENHRCIYG